MKLKTIINGGMFAGNRTYIVSGIGILSAIAAYLSGDINIFEMMNAIFPLAGIYFLRKSSEKKSKQPKEGKNGNSKKIPK